MLGTMLRYNQDLNQQDTLARLSERDRAIQERRARMAKFNKDIEDMQRENSDNGSFEKLLSMSPTSMIFLGSIDKLINVVNSSNIRNQDEAFKLLSNVDKSASKEDIENILDIMVDRMKEDNTKKYIFDIESYEYFNRNEDLTMKEIEDMNISNFNQRKIKEERDREEILKEMSNIEMSGI